jgi:hypothetical protein
VPRPELWCSCSCRGLGCSGPGCSWRGLAVPRLSLCRGCGCAEAVAVPWPGVFVARTGCGWGRGCAGAVPGLWLCRGCGCAVAGGVCGADWLCRGRGVRVRGTGWVAVWRPAGCRRCAGRLIPDQARAVSGAARRLEPEGMAASSMRCHAFHRLRWRFVHSCLAVRACAASSMRCHAFHPSMRARRLMPLKAAAL